MNVDKALDPTGATVQVLEGFVVGDLAEFGVASSALAMDESASAAAASPSTAAAASSAAVARASRGHRVDAQAAPDSAAEARAAVQGVQERMRRMVLAKEAVARLPPGEQVAAMQRLLHDMEVT